MCCLSKQPQALPIATGTLRERPAQRKQPSSDRQKLGYCTMAEELSKEEEKTDWYVVLGLDVGASEKDVNKAFKKMSLVWHPDKNGGSEEAHSRFMKIKEAKLFLLDGKKRKVYDEKRAARRKTEALLAERNRTMCKRQRELRVELERREKEAANESFSSPSGGRGLGAGGEARVAAAKLDELRKKGEAERQRQSADWSVKSANAKSASAKKRSARSSGLSEAYGGGDGDDDALEERTLRVKWKTKKESHSDYTLDALFSKFGAVQSVSIEEGRGDRALVVFASANSADAAMAAYGDRESSDTMRTSYVGKRRPKRSAFAPRRETRSPKTPATPAAGGSGERESLSSFRDRESVVMMNLRKEAERQALIRKMAEEEGLAVADSGKSATPVTARHRAAESPTVTAAVESMVAPSGEGVQGRHDLPESAASSSLDGDHTGKNVQGHISTPVRTSENRGAGVAASAASAAVTAARESGAGVAQDGFVDAGDDVSGRNRPTFPIPSPTAARAMLSNKDLKTRRKSDALLSTVLGVGDGYGDHSAVTGAGGVFGVGSKSVPTTPVSGRSAAGQVIDESDILARMMAMKR